MYISVFFLVVFQGSRDDLMSVGSTDSRRISTTAEKDHSEFRSAYVAQYIQYVTWPLPVDIIQYTGPKHHNYTVMHNIYTQLYPLTALCPKAAVSQICAAQNVCAFLSQDAT